MVNILKLLFGVACLIAAIIWFIYERGQFLKEREDGEYTLMSFTIEFILGALVLLGVGIRLIYDSLNA